MSCHFKNHPTRIKFEFSFDYSDLYFENQNFFGFTCSDRIKPNPSKRTPLAQNIPKPKWGKRTWCKSLGDMGTYLVPLRDGWNWKEHVLKLKGNVYLWYTFCHFKIIKWLFLCLHIDRLGVCHEARNLIFWLLATLCVAYISNDYRYT